MSVLTDELLMVCDKIRINGSYYSIDLNCKTFAVGDLVLDRKDGSYAFIDKIMGDRFALREGFAIEIGVTIDRLVKLQYDHGQIGSK